MPFVKQDLRAPLLRGDIEPKAVGDLCFLEYSKIIDSWRKDRRWTTVHNEAKRLFGFDDRHAAKFLAFLEFYIREAHQYENEKVEENGGI